jgi:hypothetical protein
MKSVPNRRVLLSVGAGGLVVLGFVWAYWTTLVSLAETW